MLRAALVMAVVTCVGCTNSEWGESQACDVDTLRDPVDVGCGDVPELCRADHEVVAGDVNRARAIHVVFVGDGFQQRNADDYRAHVATLVQRAQEDSRGILGRRPGLFVFHRVELWTSEAGRVLDANRADTPLGGCLADDPEGTTRLLTASTARARLAARRAVERPDVVVVLLDTLEGRANAVLAHDVGKGQAAVVRLNMLDDARVLDHELGHALVGLEDEYSDVTTCAPDPRGAMVFSTAAFDPMAVPNLTYDATGARWSGLVDGATPGGSRYACGVFHPNSPCRMEDSLQDGYCPVCNAAIESELDHRARGERDGPARCAVELDQHPQALSGSFSMLVECFDRDGVTNVTVQWDDVLLHRANLWGLRRDLAWVDVTPPAPAVGSHTLTVSGRDAQGETFQVVVPVTVR